MEINCYYLEMNFPVIDNNNTESTSTTLTYSNMKIVKLLR